MVIILENGRGVLFVDELKEYVNTKDIQRRLYEYGSSTLEIEQASKTTEEIDKYFTYAISILTEIIIDSYSLGTNNYCTTVLNNALDLIQNNNKKKWLDLHKDDDSPIK